VVCVVAAAEVVATDSVGDFAEACRRADHKRG